MSRKAFHLLLKKYLDGTCSPKERELVNQWYELLDDDGLLSKQTEDLLLIEDRIWQKIQKNIDVQQSPAIRRKSLTPSVIPAAYKWIAAILIIIAGMALITLHQTKDIVTSVQVYQVLQNEDFFTKTNHSNSSCTIELMDGSRVQLQPGTTLSYPKQFAQAKREVYLDGTASFAVAKNPARPFLVYTGTIVTQVLGTSFTIKKENNRFEVAVLTGKVAVYEEGNKQLHNKGGVVITPNEKVTYYSDNHHFVTSLVDNPIVIKNEEDSIAIKEPFSFDETQVADVITQLEKTYSVQIITENDKINRCLFSGTLSGGSLYNMLDIICQAIGANYEIRGTSIILTGTGCN